MTIPTWKPVSRIIDDITNSNPGVVTTTTAHGYLTGLYVRLVLPGDFGMTQVNGNVYLITVLTPTTFAISTDTTNFDVFSPSGGEQSPQVIPVGEVSEILTMAEKNAEIPIGGGI